MKGNGIERDTLDGVISAMEKVDAKWHCTVNQMNYADFRDALHYLQEYRDLLNRTRSERLIDILREVRGEK